MPSSHDETEEVQEEIQDRANAIFYGKLRIRLLHRLAERPPLFEQGEALFWNDPHISTKMLEAHLNPEIEGASRPPHVIERTVDWLTLKMGLQPGDRLLDLGCGPGLYCTRFAERGIQVTGVDYSRRSINYAVTQAQARCLPIEYLYENYVSMDAMQHSERFQGIVMIYGDICVLDDTARDKLLANVHTMLAPGALFAFDVTTPTHRDRFGSSRDWSIRMGGFWKPGPYLVLDQLFDYPEAEVYLRRSLVIEEDGEISDYRIWTHLYTLETMEPVLRRAGFELVEVWSDLEGTRYSSHSEWLGFLVRKSHQSRK